MGYGRYELHGMERGYMVPDVCHREGCAAEIDRGLGYLCYGCELYFCGDHLVFADAPLECFAGESHQCCQPCCDSVEPNDDDEPLRAEGQE